MVDKILVGTDGKESSTADPVVDTAADLASTLGAELVVLAMKSAVDMDDVLGNQGLAASKDHIQRVRSRFPEMRLRSMEVAGEWPGAILEAARQEDPDLIIVPRLREVEAVAVGTVDGNGNQAFEPAPGRRRLRSALQGLRAFYARPAGWLTLLAMSVLLTYGGGAVMFWVHAIIRGERGPAIDHWYHWVLDSSLGFLALTPALFFILPAALWALGTGKSNKRRLTLWSYVAVVGALFALVTGPGPLLHNAVAGEGTAVADMAERVFGHDAMVAEGNTHAMEHSPLTEGLLQVGIGLPLYMALSGLALRSARAVFLRRQNTGQPKEEEGR